MLGEIYLGWLFFICIIFILLIVTARPGAVGEKEKAAGARSLLNSFSSRCNSEWIQGSGSGSGSGSLFAPNTIKVCVGWGGGFRYPRSTVDYKASYKGEDAC